MQINLRSAIEKLRRLVWLCLLLAVSAANAAGRPAAKGSAAADSARGKLVVFVSIDQLRYQDLLLLAPELGPAGFAGLGQPLQLRYDSAITETAADHATLATGAWPELHGIIANKWLENGRDRQAVDDASCPLWYRPDDGRSAAALRAPTIGDALKIGTAGRARVISVANKDRVALLLAGATADLALFWDDQWGVFVSTTCYTPAPPTWVDALNAAHRLTSFRDYVWTPSRPLELLGRYSDLDAPDVLPNESIGARFPHPVGQGDVSPRLALALRHTPAATTLTLAAARAAVESLALGDQETSDLLMVGIATIDGVGHQFGAHAPERIDALLRLHDELGAFVNFLRARFRDRVAIVLSADHGVTPIAGELNKLHMQVPALDRDAVAILLERELAAQLGRAPPAEEIADAGTGANASGYIEFFEPPSLWLRHPSDGSREIHRAAEILRRQVPGLYRVVETAPLFESEELLNASPSFIRHAIYPGRSSDLILIPRPLHILKKSADAADHGSPWNDDALVPLLAQTPGWSVRPQFRGGIVLATQVAPTLAALLGVSPPSAALAEPVLMRDP